MDEPGGRVTVSAEVLDMSVGGCELRVFTPVNPAQAARLGIEVRQTTVWVPVRTRSVRRSSRGWTLSCAFERPTAEQQRSVYVLMAECNAK
jgi:PilZ domain